MEEKSSFTHDRMRWALLLGLLCLVNLLWGASWVVSKPVLEVMSPLQLGGWRMIIAGLALSPWFYRALKSGAIKPRELPALAALGFVGFVADKALNYWGLALSTALNASLLMAAEPLLTLVLARLLLREALTGRKMAGIALGGCGAYLVIAGGLHLPQFSSLGVVGDLLFLSGLLLEALYSVWGKATLQRHSPLTVTAATIVTAALIWAPIVAVDGAVNGWPQPGWAELGAVLFLSLGCTVFGYMVWLFALGYMEVGVAGMTILLQPLFGALLSTWLLGDLLTTPALIGGGLVMAGLYLVIRAGDRDGRQPDKAEFFQK